MDTFLWALKLFGVLAGMVSIIPLSIWAMSGDWRYGLYALKQYLLIMGGIVAVGAVMGGLAIIAS